MVDTGNGARGIQLLSEAAEQLEARQRKIHVIHTVLPELEVISADRFRTENLDLYVEQDDEHPVRQLCSAIGMTHGFFKANPGALNRQIFQTRFAGEDKGNRVLRVLETDKGNRLLAVLPERHVAPSYADILRPLASVLPADTEVRLQNFDRINTDHRMNLRVSFPGYQTTVAEGDDIQLGLYADFSEDGVGSRARIAAMLYQLICSNGAMITHANVPLIEFNYRGLAQFALDAVIESAMLRFADDLPTIGQHCLSASGEVWTKDEAIAFVRSLEGRRDFSLTFARKVRKEVQALDLPTLTKWQVLSTVTKEAQKLPLDARVRHEFAAGALLGLDLPDRQN